MMMHSIHLEQKWGLKILNFTWVLWFCKTTKIKKYDPPPPRLCVLGKDLLQRISLPHETQIRLGDALLFIQDKDRETLQIPILCLINYLLNCFVPTDQSEQNTCQTKVSSASLLGSASLLPPGSWTLVSCQPKLNIQTFLNMGWPRGKPFLALLSCYPFISLLPNPDHSIIPALFTSSYKILFFFFLFWDPDYVPGSWVETNSCKPRIRKPKKTQPNSHRWIVRKLENGLWKAAAGNHLVSMILGVSRKGGKWHECVN